MVNKGRRRLIFTFPALAGLVVLTGCQGLNNVLAPEEGFEQDKVLKRSVQSVSDFLDSRFDTYYTSDPDWVVEGEILTFLYGWREDQHWGEGQYKYFVNGQYIEGSIKSQNFDPITERLRIEKWMEQTDGSWDWESIWSWPRHRGAHYNIHEQVSPEPR